MGRHDGNVPAVPSGQIVPLLSISYGIFFTLFNQEDSLSSPLQIDRECHSKDTDFHLSEGAAARIFHLRAASVSFSVEDERLCIGDVIISLLFCGSLFYNFCFWDNSLHDVPFLKILKKVHLNIYIRPSLIICALPIWVTHTSSSSYVARSTQRSV